MREDELKKAMKNPKKSIHVVTALVHNCLTEISSGKQFEEVEAIVREACNSPELNNHSRGLVENSVVIFAALIYNAKSEFRQKSVNSNFCKSEGKQLL